MSSQQQKMPAPMKFFFTKIFPLIFLCVGGGILYTGIADLSNAYESTDWPDVPGKIKKSTVKTSHSSSSRGGSSTTYHADIIYTYSVNGKAYEGKTVAYGDYGSSSYSHAGEIVRRYPVGKTVRVYYKPDKPTETVLENGAKTQAFFMPGFGFIFFLAGAVMMIKLPSALKEA